MAEIRENVPLQNPAGPPAQPQGHLKVFLGYASGVGKTYAMLEASHQRKDEGMDVAIGIVETHRRPETEALLAGLEVILPLRLPCENNEICEMDLDAVLARRP